MNNKKTIFFLVPFYLDLYKDIVAELEKEYAVVLFEDKILKSKYTVPDTIKTIKKLIKYFYSFLFNPWLRYWEKIINASNEFNRKYDIFLCINGFSFHPIIIKRLKTINPQLKTVLYLWDITKAFDFSVMFKYFHRVITFDKYDATKYDLEYLPFYWIDEGKENVSKQREIKGVFFLGTNHDDRYWILKKVIKVLDAISYPYYIKLLVSDDKIPTIISLIEYLYYLIFSKKDKIEYWNVFYGKYIPPFVTSNAIPSKIYNQMLSEYDCILDTERPDQVGVTLRTIWALAKNKKIITTNKNIIHENFYNSDLILIIDRDNPVIPASFLNKTIENNTIIDSLIKLRIDNWVKEICR